MIEVIDTFLPKEEFNSIQSFMTGLTFPWYFYPNMVRDGDGKFQFLHVFYQPEVGPNSNNIELFTNFMTMIGAKKCKRIKANLTLRTSTPEESLFHTDYNDIKTAIFYINTNNGYTEFESGVRVSSVANRVCIFDSNLEHRGVTHTDGEHQRIVVNFNYA